MPNNKTINYCHCGKRAHGHGLCRKHYQEIYRDKSDEKYFTSLKGRFNVLQRNAKNKNREHLTFEEFVKFWKNNKHECYYCNGKLNRGSACDRLNNDLGYHVDNIVFCCKNCNSLKSNLLSSKETKEIIKLLKKLRKTDNLWTNK